MNMTTNMTTELAFQLDFHWTQALRPRLVGLTNDEYFWQPVPGCGTISRRGQSHAPVSYGSGEFTWDYGTATPGAPPRAGARGRAGAYL